MNGIDVTYSLNSKYFEIGEAYSIRLGTNKFRIGLLISRSDDFVKFKIIDEGDVVDLILTIDQLRFNDYWMTKMKPDYENGKFSNT